LGTSTLGPALPDWGLDAWLTTLLCKNIITKSKEIKSGCSLAESSKEGCGSKRAVLPMMMNEIQGHEDVWESGV
jgi:hypothetical protein